jgi:uncharacterized protein (TIGR03437 family)
VRQVEQAFGTEIHNFSVNGQMHFANSTVLTVPAAVGKMILAVHGLNDFRKQPHAKVLAKLPKYTSGTAGTHYLAPGDIAAIYDMKPLWDSGITGAGQKIVIVGQSAVNVTDIEQFRSFFNLPAMDPQMVTVPSATVPGIVSGDVDESDLDLEFAGAAAPNATIVFVYSNDVDLSLQYAIDQNLAPVISMSYGDCEYDNGVSGQFGLNGYRALAQQANALGITWMAASGDSGAADCYGIPGVNSTVAAGLAIDAPGSVPEVTSVGGTELNEGSGTYFAAANDPNHTSVTNYVPEMVWNDTSVAGSPSASGGGASTYFTKPTWQSGPGVPADGFRDVPDISLAAAVYHDPRMYYGSGTLGLIGGTSVSAPTFAGIVAMLNQYLVANGLQSTSGVGNVNPRLYALAQSAPAAFHDITVGDNMVDACSGRRCTAGSVGFTAGPGYDQTTGLGSLDAFNLVTSWAQTSTAAKGSVSMTLLGGPTSFTASVTSSNGGTPTGTVTLVTGGATLATATLNSSGIATLTASALPAGFDSVTAKYSGDANYSGAAASLSFSITSPTVMSITGLTNAASYKQAYAPGEIMAVFGNLLSGSTQSAPTIPLPTTLGGVTATINGIAAPLYFVSPGQINLQIPYGLTSGSVANLVVTYNGQSASSGLYLTGAAPGIFLDSTGAPAGAASAKRGSTIALYVTGQGAVSPQPATGALPASGTVPVPQQTMLVSIGGVTLSTPYAYIGIPAWAIGLTQINVTIPGSVPLGPQPVIVTSGTSVSAAATINITQ